jgi:RecA/RadA recombinase
VCRLKEVAGSNPAGTISTTGELIMARSTKAMKAELGRKRKKEPTIRTSDLLSTGSTLLNLACSGRYKGAIPVGRYLLMVGKSAAGKTWLAHQIMAEAANNKRFDDHELYYDDAEGGALMDKEHYFGKRVVSRLKAPHKDGASRYLEEFYDRVDDLAASGQPFIYVLDSQDVLTTKAEQKAVKKHRMQRNKIHSQRIRNVVTGVQKTDSILIILSQTRKNMGFSSRFNPDVRAGGEALRFYNHLELWLRSKGRKKKKVNGKDRDVGTDTMVKIEKNRVSGRLGTIPILWSYGVDDISSCIDYLIEERHWKETRGVLLAEDLDFEGPRRKLIKQIEKEGLETDLREVVQTVWRQIEEATKANRKPRYE